MSYGRPSRAVALVSPLIACLVAEYAIDCGLGTWAEIDPLLMIRPPRGTCRRICPKASRVQRNAPVRLTATQACQSAKLIEPSMPVDRGAEQLAHRLLISDIRRHGVKLELRMVVDQLIKRIGSPSGDNNVPAVGCPCRGRCGTNPAPCPRDDRNPLLRRHSPPSAVAPVCQDRSMRIAVIGTGTVGRTLGEGLAKVGHDVVVGTRDPARTRARDELQAISISLGSYGEVGTGAELFVNATNGAASLEALLAVGDEALAGKVLIDVSNALDQSAGFPPTLFASNTDSLAEQLQRAFPRTKVVKAFNTKVVR